MIHLLNEVAEEGFGSAAFLTYGIDLNFFDAEVMGRLQESGCRNVLVVADGHQLKDDLNSAAWLRYVGVHCSVVPVRLGNRAFHPKAVLMIGEEKLKVLVGSGNLTLPGYTRNWEIFTKVEGEDAVGTALDLLGVFENAARRSPVEEAFSRWRQRLERFSPWLSASHPSDSSTHLLCSSEGAILPRVKNLLSERVVERILVTSPFFDANAFALRWLIENMLPEELTLLVDEGVRLDPTRVEETLTTVGHGSAVLRFVGEGRPLHGKALLFTGPWGQALLAGSPNLSSAALLGRAGSDGNFELATFQLASAGEFSSLFDNKRGDLVNLRDVSPQRPDFAVERVSPLELEAVWLSDGVLYATPAGGDSEEQHSIEIRLELHDVNLGAHRLDKGTARNYQKRLGQEELAELAGVPVQARLLGTGGQLGAPVWVQNLDTVEERSHPAHHARYAKGLRALSEDSLGFDPDAWENLFEAFVVLAQGWNRRAEETKKRPRLQPQPASEGQERRWEPGESFYVYREDVALELPAYFARVESAGLAIGDYEYLIAALPTANKLSPPAPLSQESTDTPPAEEKEEEEGDAEVEEAENGEPEPSEPTEEQKRRIGRRLYNRFRSFIREFEASLSQAPVETRAEANYQCSRYVLLHRAIARAASIGYLGPTEFRELASWLTNCWAAGLWAPMLLEDKDEVESVTGCAAASLAAVAAISSTYVRQQVRTDEFDADLYSSLAKTLKDLRPFFVDLKKDVESRKLRPEWTKAMTEYNGLLHMGTTSYGVLSDLKRRYELWRLNDESPLRRTLREEGIIDSSHLEGNILRIRAELPDSSRRRDLLRKLLYLVHGGTGKPAAVVWENTWLTDRIGKLGLVLLAADRVALEVTHFRNGNCLAWRHSVSGGSPGSGVFLINSQTLDCRRLQTQSQHESPAGDDLLESAAALVPDLFP